MLNKNKIYNKNLIDKLQAQIHELEIQNMLLQRKLDAAGIFNDSISGSICGKELTDELTAGDLAFKYSKNAFAITDISGRIMHVNNSYINLWQISDKSNLTCEYYLSAWQLEAKRSVISQVLDSGAGWYGNLSFKRKNGTEFHAGLSLNRILDGFNRPAGLLAEFVVISEQNSAVEIMDERDNSFRMLAENLPVVVARFDREYRHVYINSITQKVFGKHPDEIRGKTHREIGYSREQSEYAESIIKRIFNSGEEVNFEIEHRSSGTTRYFVSRGVPEFDNDGRVTNALIIHNDITDLRESRDELARKIKLLNDIVENCPSLIYTVDPDGRFTSVNRHFTKVFKKTDSEIIGKYREEFLNPQVAARHRENDLEIIKAGKAIPFNEENIEDGIIHYYFTTKFPLHNENNEIYGIGGISTDITEQKNTEIALKKSETNLRQVLNNSQDALYCRDFINNIYIYMSSAIFNITGFDPGEFILMPLDSVISRIHPEDELIVKQNTACSVFTSGMVVKMEYRFKNKSGQYRWLQDYFTTICDTDGRPALCYGSVRDITERNELEEKLKRSEMKYRQIVELAREGIWSIDTDGNTIYVNPHMAEMLGYSEEEMAGKPFILFMDDDGKAVVQKVIDNLKKGISGHQDLEFIHKNGSKIYTSVGITSIFNNNGSYAGVIALVADITASKSAKNALKKINDELEMLVVERTKELNNTITALYESEEKYRTVADFTYDWEFWVDKKDVFIYNSPSCERITGYTPDIFLDDQSFYNSIIHPDDREMMTARSKEIISCSDIFTVDFRIVRRDGTVIWLGHQSQPVFNSKGEWTGRRGSNRDVTERIDLIKKIEASEAHYRLLLESVTDCIYKVKNNDGELTGSWFGKGCESITGYTSGEYDNDNMLWYKIIFNEDRVSVLNSLDKMYQLNLPISFEHRIVGKDGSIRWIRNTVVPDFSTNGTYLGYDGMVIDITENKQREEEVRRLNRYIIEVQENERKRLSKDLHDSVSQMISAAKINFGSFTYNPTDFKNRYKVGMDFLDMASRELIEIYTGLYPSILQDLGLTATIRWYSLNQLERNGIKTDLNITLEEKFISYLEINIYRIIQEIFSNIIKHSGATEVKVLIFHINSELSIEVSDNGNGFQTVNNKNNHYGLLNISQRVSNMSGKLEINSDEKGTDIIIRIPTGV